MEIQIQQVICLSIGNNFEDSLIQCRYLKTLSGDRETVDKVIYLIRFIFMFLLSLN
jgi:hypothetical protein